MATLPTGSISLGDIQNYYGGTNPISLSEYYAETYEIPSSGTISLNTFRGKPGYYGDRMISFSGSTSSSYVDFTLTISTNSSASTYSNTMSSTDKGQFGGQKGASNGTIALFADDFRDGTTSTDDITNGTDACYWVSISTPATSHGYGGALAGLGPVLGQGASNGVSVLWGGGAFRYETGSSLNRYTVTIYAGRMRRQTISTTAVAQETGGINDAFGWDPNDGAMPNGVVSNVTRGVWIGARNESTVTAYTNNMTYQTITSNSNAATFGVLGTDGGTRSYLTGCADARTRGLIAGGTGAPGSSSTDRIDYITISTAGNSTNFGNLRAAATAFGGSGGNGNRCVFAKGNYVDYVNPDSTGNAANWGNLPGTAYNGGCACGNI